MSINDIVEEIRTQLQDDLLSYGWLKQIVRNFLPDASLKQIVNLVYTAVEQLLNSAEIKVGKTTIENGFFSVKPWEGEVKHVLSKLKHEIDNEINIPENERDDIFWIEDASNFSDTAE